MMFPLVVFGDAQKFEAELLDYRDEYEDVVRVYTFRQTRRVSPQIPFADIMLAIEIAARPLGAEFELHILPLQVWRIDGYVRDQPESKLEYGAALELVDMAEVQVTTALEAWGYQVRSGQYWWADKKEISVTTLIEPVLDMRILLAQLADKKDGEFSEWAKEQLKVL